MLPTAAIAVLALVPATYASALAHVQSVPALVASVLVPALLLTVALEVLRRRHPFRAVAAALVIIVALLAIDVLSGARLQVNTLFGYSTAVAGRFAGLGNLAFGFLAAATLLLAVTAYEGIPGRRGLHVAIGILVAGVLVEGLPMLGGDVGGVLAMVPAFGVTVMVLTGHRVRVRHVVAWCAAGAATVLAFGYIDLARPSDQRTHLARFLERVRDHGADEISRLLERRWEASFGGTRIGLFLLIGVAGALVVEYGFWRLSAYRGPRVARAGRAALVGLGLLARHRTARQRFGDRRPRGDARGRGARRHPALRRVARRTAARRVPREHPSRVRRRCARRACARVRARRRAGVAGARP